MDTMNMTPIAVTPVEPVEDSSLRDRVKSPHRFTERLTSMNTYLDLLGHPHAH